MYSVKALKHCATLLGSGFVKEKIIKSQLILFIISTASTSQCENVPYHPKRVGPTLWFLAQGTQ